MKNFMHKSIGAILFTGALIAGGEILAQTQKVGATTSTITSEGTISEFGPAGVTIRTEAGATPVRYLSNDTTNYVDQEGNPITVTGVKSGLPVTVYYNKVGDTLYASKIMVHVAAAAPAPIVETTQTTTMSAGTISEFGPERIIIRTESSPDPLRYSYGKTTTYVDESGRPVSIKTVKSGLPVTVYHTKVGNALVATKVIVRKAAVVPIPLVEQKKTTTTTTTREN